MEMPAASYLLLLTIESLLLHDDRVLFLSGSDADKPGKENINHNFMVTQLANNLPTFQTKEPYL